jgi:hypothetical protein
MEIVVLHLMIKKLWKILPLEEVDLIRNLINNDNWNGIWYSYQCEHITVDLKYGIKYPNNKKFEETAGRHCFCLPCALVRCGNIIRGN